MDEQLQIWESIMMTAISKRDSYQVGTYGYKQESKAVEELQQVFIEKFGQRFTYGFYSE